MRGMGPTFRKGTEILLGEFAGDAIARVANKFGLAKALSAAKIPANYSLPVTRILIGLFGNRLLGMAPRLFKPSFRQTFAAINVAEGLISLTNGIRGQIFHSVGLAGYELAGFADWETAGDGVGLLDWETASDGVGLLGDAPPAGILGEDYYGEETFDDEVPYGVF